MSDPKYYCYVIAPIGDNGTETRENYHNLFETLLVPVLGEYVTIKGGTHVHEEGQVQDQVRAEIQKADFCIADISIQNINVYYEIGYCTALNKHMIYVKRRNSEDVPVDLGIPKWVEYDLSSGAGNSFLQAFNKTSKELLDYFRDITQKLEADTYQSNKIVDLSKYDSTEIIEFMDKITDQFKEFKNIFLQEDQCLASM